MYNVAMRYIHYKSNTMSHDDGIRTYSVYGKADDPLPKAGDAVVIDASIRRIIKIEFIKKFDFSRRVELLIIAK